MKIGFWDKGKMNLKPWGKVLFVALTAIGVATETSAQRYRNQFMPYSTVGLGVGTASYYGDLAPVSRVLTSTFYMMRWNVSGEYTRHFSPRFGARVGLTWARLAGDDYIMNRSGVPRANHEFFLRNLHFRNDVMELSAVGIFKLTPDGRVADRRSQFGAYLFAGVGVFAHNPKARLPVDPAEPGEKQRWTALRPLGTEGQGLPEGPKLYSLVNLAIPVGFGVRYKINPKFDIAAELGFRFTTSDYLDDVSGGYPSNRSELSPEAQIMTARYLEVNPARKPDRDRTADLVQYLGLQEGSDPFAVLASGSTYVPRGDSPGKADKYMTGTIKVTYVLGSSVKCPPLK